MAEELPAKASIVPSTIDEAKARGLKKIAKPNAWHPDGISIRPIQPRFICYIGPCDPDTKTRTICYYMPPQANGGCNECYEWNDIHCQG